MLVTSSAEIFSFDAVAEESEILQMFVRNEYEESLKRILPTTDFSEASRCGVPWVSKKGITVLPSINQGKISSQTSLLRSISSIISKGPLVFATPLLLN